MKTKNNDLDFREFALTGDLRKVLFSVGFPIAFYQLVNLIFKLIDSILASYIGASSVSAVTFLTQISNVVGAIGGGLAIGGSLEISKAYGLGDFELVKKRLSSLYLMTTCLVAMVLLMIPFSNQILIFVKTPQELMEIGNEYFRMELFNLVLIFYNNLYFAVERVRGNGKKILKLNLLSVAIKLSLSAIFIYGMDADIFLIGAANVISQCVILIIGLKNLTDKESIFCISLKNIDFSRRVVKPMTTLSFPVMIEKSAFSLGKVFINSMSSQYGTLAVGALGVSNNLASLTLSAQIGIQEAGSAIISQNVGAGKRKRAVEVFKNVLIFNLIIGAVGFIFTMTFIEALSYIFAFSSKGVDTEFQNMIITMYRYEAYGDCIPLAINTAVISLLLGFGFSKLTLLINFCRIFVFRVPVMWALQNYTDLGYEACGIVMLISNLCISIFSTILLYFVLKRIKKSYTPRDFE